MLHYDRVDISKGIDPTNSTSSKEWMIFNHEFKFQDFLWKGCHDLTILCLNISDIAIITAKDFDYCFIIHNISKSKAINLLNNSVVNDRSYI